jgi:hypothetical protein
MSIAQRKHTRFSLDIPALLITKFGERQETVLQQISVGGCFTDWEENIYIGDEFRLEVELPNKNRLPLKCKAVYLFEGTGVGARFIDITQFEQDLVSKIISHRLELEGLPVEINAFNPPSQIATLDQSRSPADARAEMDILLEKVMSGDDE